jgi:hypothetical protein
VLFCTRENEDQAAHKIPPVGGAQQTQAVHRERRRSSFRVYFREHHRQRNLPRLEPNLPRRREHQKHLPNDQPSVPASLRKLSIVQGEKLSDDDQPRHSLGRGEEVTREVNAETRTRDDVLTSDDETDGNTAAASKQRGRERERERERKMKRV